MFINNSKHYRVRNCQFTYCWHFYKSRGGHSHFGGDADVRLLIPPFSAPLSRNYPIFCYFLTQRPHFRKILLSPQCPKCSSQVRPKGPIFLKCSPRQKCHNFWPKLSFIFNPILLWNFSFFSILSLNDHIFLCSRPMTHFFFRFALTECPLVSKCQPFTHIHFILKCPRIYDWILTIPAGQVN